MKIQDLMKRQLDLKKAFEVEPPPLDFIWSGFLARTVGALVAPGATSKSFFALEAGVSIAVSVASGTDLMGLGIQKTGRVVYFGLEDPEEIVEHRAHAIGKLLSPESRAEAADKFRIFPLVGDDFDIMDEETSGTLIECCTGVRLAVFDTLSRAHRLEENSNGDMTKLICRLESIARKTGTAILYLHHVSKGSARGEGDQHAARGATALTDNARCAMALSKMTEDESGRLCDPSYASGRIDDNGDVIPDPINSNRTKYVRRSVPKNNYSAPIEDQWFRRGDGGVLQPINLIEMEKVGEIKKQAKKYARESQTAQDAHDKEGWTHVSPF